MNGDLSASNFICRVKTEYLDKRRKERISHFHKSCVHTKYEIN